MPFLFTLFFDCRFSCTFLCTFVTSHEEIFLDLSVYLLYNSMVPTNIGYVLFLFIFYIFGPVPLDFRTPFHWMHLRFLVYYSLWYYYTFVWYLYTRWWPIFLPTWQDFTYNPLITPDLFMHVIQNTHTNFL